MNQILSIWLSKQAINQRATPLWHRTLLKQAYKFSPIVEVDNGTTGQEKWGLNLDLTGCARFFKGEERLLTQIYRTFSGNNIKENTPTATLKLCLAPTLGAAWAFSRYGEANIKIIRPQELDEVLAPLPVTALRLNSSLVQELLQLNIFRIAHLFAIPSADIQRRFPKELYIRLQQALGLIPEPLQAVPFVPTVKATCSLASSSRDSVSYHLYHLLEELLAQLNPARQKIKRLILGYKTAHAPQRYRELPLTLPSANKNHLWRLLSLQLEALALEEDDFADEIVLTLYAPDTEEERACATSFLPTTVRTPAQDLPFAELLASLSEQLGPRKVLQAKPRPSHIPENTLRYTPAINTFSQESPHRPPANAAALEERPSILFYQPQPIEALTAMPETPPFSLKWRNQTYDIISGIGPERIAPEWWWPKWRREDEPPCDTRDYFKIQLQHGLWLWVFRELTQGRWYVHGIWA